MANVDEDRVDRLFLVEVDVELAAVCRWETEQIELYEL